MISIEKQLLPNRDAFSKDPFGYSALAWYKWRTVQALAGEDIDVSKSPTSDDLKSPLLWFTQANAMSEAAKVIIQYKPDWKSMPINVRGVCDSQYCAVALMLIGYSLEICLKAMLIIQKGIGTYASEEKKHKHHNLEKLANFIHGLTDKDKAILKLLTDFVTWAGRYPDPGSGRENDSENIFIESEKYQISAEDMFLLTIDIMKHTKQVIDGVKG